MSEKYKLNKEDGIKIMKGACIAGGGAVLTFLLDILPQIEVGEHMLWLIPFLSFTINAALKWIKEH